jgi:hypothetical protein
MTRRPKPDPDTTPRLALTIPAFCKSFNISERFYRKLKTQGLGPVEMKIGARTLISLEAIDAWRRAREQKEEAQ